MSDMLQDRFLTRGGQAEAVIVIRQESGPFYRWVAGEVQRYVRELSGAELHVVTDDALPRNKTLILLGGPGINPLAASAEQQRLVRFAGLKPEGFLVRTIELEGRPVIVAGGNDEAGTMYAAYELLERLGIVFQLTNDIIPRQKPDLPLPALDIRMEPELKYRGMGRCHGLSWHMGVEDFRKHINQLAKLKMNCLQFYFGMGSPWVEYAHNGKTTEIIYSPESGYTAWDLGHNTSATSKDVRVGRECFPNEYLGAPEFANVRTPGEAFAVAREFLREIISYAHKRKIQVWLTLGEIPAVPPNLVPNGVKEHSRRWSGVSIPYGEPAVLEIWEEALLSMIKNYPDADAYSIWMAEHSSPTDDSKSQAYLNEYAYLRKSIPPIEEINRQGSVHPRSAQELDSDFCQIAIADKVIHRVKTSHPNVKLGVCIIFRGYLVRLLDAVLPKDVWLMNMENFLTTGPVMHFYGGVTGRELLVQPRIDDDGCELHMQLNAVHYDQDLIIAGAVRYGLAGVIGQLNKERGLECPARYIAEGAWRADIDAKSFYEGYLGRLYGPEVRDELVKGFLILEENEKALGWQGRCGIFRGYARFTLSDLSGQSGRPYFFTIKPASFWLERAEQCGPALDLFRKALPRVPKGSCPELEYVIFKTEDFILYFRVLNSIREAVASFEQAGKLEKTGYAGKAQEELIRCKDLMKQAVNLSREQARAMTAWRQNPTEKYLLLRYNQNVVANLEDDLKLVEYLLEKEP